MPLTLANQNSPQPHGEAGRPMIGVTGATGFLGGYVMRSLLSAERYDIRALARSVGSPELFAPGLSWLRGDLASPADCGAFVRDLDAVIHFAHTNTPLSSHSDWASDAALNIIPTLNLIEAVRREGRKVHFIFASSGGAVYGSRADSKPFSETDKPHPTSPYGLVKLIAEDYFRLASEQGWLTASVLRIGNPYGELLPSARRQGLIGVAMNQFLRGEPVPIYGDPNNVRDYIHLSDVAAIIKTCLLKKARRQFDIYNVGSGTGTSTSEILDLLERVVGKEIQRHQLDQIDNADRMISWTVLDIAKARQDLGWHPRVSLEDGVEDLYEQFRCKGGLR